MRTALVVDDEAMLRRQVSEVLENYGFERILEAENGLVAVALAEREKPLLIVMDVGMPVMDGITAAEKMSKTVTAPIVLLTGNAEPELVERARLAGVMSYVVKPFRTEQLMPAVDLAIHHFMQVSTLREEVTELKEALETRKLVERAKAALIRKGMAEPDAYRKLQRLAMDRRKTMKEVAEAVLLTED